MILTSNGRPLAQFPDWIARMGNQYLLRLTRIDVSDVGNQLVAAPIYHPFLEIVPGSVTTIIVRTGRLTALLFLSPRKISFQTIKDEDDTNSQSDTE